MHSHGREDTKREQRLLPWSPTPQQTATLYFVACREELKAKEKAENHKNHQDLRALWLASGNLGGYREWLFVNQRGSILSVCLIVCLFIKAGSPGCQASFKLPAKLMMTFN